MRGGHERPDEETADEDGAQRHAQGQAREQPGVMNGEQREFLLVTALDGGGEGVSTPQRVGEGVERIAVPVLPPAKRGLSGRFVSLGSCRKYNGSSLMSPSRPSMFVNEWCMLCLCCHHSVEKPLVSEPNPRIIVHHFPRPWI